MKSLNIIDQRRRLLFLKHEYLYLYYKTVACDRRLPVEIQQRAMLKLNMFKRNVSLTRIRNCCLLSGRSRGVYRRFGLARMQLKIKIKHGDMLGIKVGSR